MRNLRPSRLDDLAAVYARKAKREALPPVDPAMGIYDSVAVTLAATRDYQLRGWLSDFLLRLYGAARVDLCPEGSEATVALDALVQVLGASNLDQARMAARIALQTIKATTEDIT